MLFAIACATAIGGVVTAAWYWRLRQTGLAALIMLFAAEGEHVQPARQRYWSLNKRAQSVAMVTIACWAICVLSLGYLDEGALLVPWIWQRMVLVGATTLSLWAMIVVAEVYNSRESEQRSKRR
jgi:hypothetical protein